MFGLACVAIFGGAAAYMPGVPPLETPLGYRLPLFSLIPFGALLAAIALFPVLAPDWWESNANKAKVAALFAVPGSGLLLFHFGLSGVNELLESAIAYLSLMTLLAALFVVCGGVVIEGSSRGTPLFNTLFLGLGAVLSNVIGTTGAAMILVRPLLRANEHRRNVAHVPIFLIFIVANCGGLLTPLGDPPLFLGFLAGVPFTWTLRLFPAWALVNGSLLAIFLAWDWVMARRDIHQERRVEQVPRPDADPGGGLRVRGLWNIAFLLAIVATVFASGRGLGNGGQRWPFGVQEVLIASLAAASLRLTGPELREKNRFTFGPMIEVAVLFAGIFATMTPALAILNARGRELGLSQPWHYFWASGLLSSVLDNAPTYLAFTALATGAQGLPVSPHYLALALDLGGRPFDPILAAISCGCVFMGALTYIGNGPNFMVRAIAQESNVRMPTFFGFMTYSATILFPLFALVTFLLFRSPV